MAVEVNPEALDAILKESRVPVLIDFWATWCGPCRVMMPALNSLEWEQGNNLKVVKVDVGQHTQVLSTYGVQSIPTLVLCAPGGGEMARHVGAASLPVLREFVSKISS